MTSITIAVSTDENPVPGVDCTLAADLFIMHAPPVRDWIAAEQAKAGDGERVVVADNAWLNRGDHVSLTVPAEERDLEALERIRERVAAAEVSTDDH